jgi:hypothetical protein
MFEWKIYSSGRVGCYIGTRFWKSLRSEFYYSLRRVKRMGIRVLCRLCISWEGQERQREEQPNGSSGALSFVGYLGRNYKKYYLRLRHVYLDTCMYRNELEVWRISEKYRTFP